MHPIRIFDFNKMGRLLTLESTSVNILTPHFLQGRRGAIEWPSLSPDLTPLDFFLWGYLKSKVYFNRPNNLDELRQRIRAEVEHITPEVLAKCLHSNRSVPNG
jgi:hypothetical protein